MSERPLRIGIIAGEASGDILGADLIRVLKQDNPDIIIEGIGGPLMIAAGCHSLFSMEPLSVTGIVEVLGRLNQILALRKKIVAHFLATPPDIFIGVDAPDFNLTIEGKLKAANIPTIHYNSPTVWAWRQKRIFKIAKTTDLMLTLFPFEKAFYDAHQVAAKFVGHPLADLIPEQVDRQQAREQLGLPVDAEIIALLPGSRANELKYLAPAFIKTARWCLQHRPDLKFTVPFINAERKAQFIEIQQQLAPEIVFYFIDGQSRTTMAAANAVLLASGTATLECLLLKRPMVVAYQLSALTYAIMKRLVKVPYIAIPNLLAQKLLVPEFVQAEVTPENLGTALLTQLDHTDQEMLHEFAKIRQQLKCDASRQAADAVLEMIGKSG